MESESAEDLFMIQQLNNKLTNQPVQIGSLITTVTNDYHPKDFFPAASANGEKECHILTPRHLVDELIWLPDRLRKEGLPEGNRVYRWKNLWQLCASRHEANTIFYDGNINHGSETSWRMIEYRLEQHSDHKYGRLDSWVLCKVYEEDETRRYCQIWKTQIFST